MLNTKRKECLTPVRFAGAKFNEKSPAFAGLFRLTEYEIMRVICAQIH
jgi:hypothetical protein